LVFFFKVDLLIFVIAPSSALITGSLTPSVIGDRPSHPISKRQAAVSSPRAHDENVSDVAALNLEL